MAPCGYRYRVKFDYDWLKSRVGLSTTLTAAYNKNKIKEVGYIPTDAIDMMQYPTNYYLKGDAYNSLYAYRYAGLTEDGNPSIYDTEGNVVSIQPVRDINALIVAGNSIRNGMELSICPYRGNP